MVKDPSTADTNNTKHELSTVTIAINTLLFGFILIWISVGILQERNENIRRSFRRFARWIARWKLRWLLSQLDDSNTATDTSTNITVSEIYIYPGKVYIICERTKKKSIFLRLLYLIVSKTNKKKIFVNDSFFFTSKNQLT